MSVCSLHCKAVLPGLARDHTVPRLFLAASTQAPSTSLILLGLSPENPVHLLIPLPIVVEVYSKSRVYTAWMENR